MANDNKVKRKALRLLISKICFLTVGGEVVHVGYKEYFLKALTFTYCL